PQREIVARYLSYLCPGSSGRSGAGDKSVLVCIASRQFPGTGDVPVQSNFITVRALTTGLNDSGGIVWIGRSGVCAFESIDGRRKRERTTEVPLDPQFVVVEL